LQVERANQWRVSLPTLACLMLATVSFGAARIHAGAITHAPHDADASGVPGERTIISVRLVEFKPHSFTQSAFADWAETAEK
jgi:hypothetical protein